MDLLTWMMSFFVLVNWMQARRHFKKVLLGRAKAL